MREETIMLPSDSIARRDFLKAGTAAAAGLMLAPAA